jgi:hypothetical protein
MLVTALISLGILFILISIYNYVYTASMGLYGLGKEYLEKRDDTE